PGEHGDALGQFRLLLETTARERVTQSGFEIGRAFAGLRGAVPVMAHQADAPPKLVGLIELGALLDGSIDRLTRSTGVGYGVLLKPNAVSATMWHAFKPPRSHQDHSCCFLLAHSRPALRQWIQEGRLAPFNAPYQIERMHAG